MASVATITRLHSSSSNGSSSGEDLDNIAHMLACFAVKAAVEDEGLRWRSCPELPTTNEEPVLAALAELCRGFRLRVDPDIYHEWLESMELSEDTAYPFFLSVSNKVCGSESMSWGRLIALFAFTGDVAVRALQEGQRQLVPRIADYLGIYLEHTQDAWVQEHGGWNNLITIANRKEEESGNSKWARLGLVAAALAIGAGAVIHATTLT